MSGIKTEWELGGLHLLEPVTSITDFMISALCFYLVFNFYKKYKDSQLTKRWMRFYLFMGSSTFLGGIAHLLFFYLEGTPHKTVWLGMNVLSVVAIYFAEIATVTLYFKDKTKVILEYVFLSLLLLFISASLYFQNFAIVKANIGIGLVFILIVHYLSYRKNIPGSAYIFTGILVSFVTMFVHGKKLSISDWFNYNDISHVIMIFSLYIMYLGVKLKGEVKSSMSV